MWPHRNWLLGNFCFLRLSQACKGENVTNQSSFPLLSNASLAGLYRRSLNKVILDQWELIVLATLDLNFWSAVWIRPVSGGEFRLGDTEQFPFPRTLQLLQNGTLFVRYNGALNSLSTLNLWNSIAGTQGLSTCRNRRTLTTLLLEQ